MLFLTEDVTQQQSVKNSSKNLNDAFQLLQEAMDIEATLLSYGLDGIDQYISNIEGEWLENWEE